MKSKGRLGLMLTVLALTAGCATQEAVSGDTRVGIATTTPSADNDYPVTYRVLMPDTDRRAKDVERVLVKSR